MVLPVPSLLSQATSLNLRFCVSKRGTHRVTSGGELRLVQVHLDA